MGATEFALNAALAIQRWSASLALETQIKQFFFPLMGEGDDALIKVKKELEKAAGEKITMGIQMKLSGDGAEGDNPIEGTSLEESLDFFHDYLFIDQRRKTTKSKGKMSEQRVPYNLRKLGRDALAIWFAEDYDQMIMMYLAGARGVATNFHVPLTFTGRANNTLQAPNADNLIYAGNATAKADLDSGDKISLGVVENLVAKVETMDPMMQPFMIGGERKHVLLMHTWQAYDLRTSTSSGDWLDIQKNAGSKSEGKNTVYKNALGEYADVILQKHRNVIRFSDYGSGSDVAAARALFLGAQAGLIAWGGQNGKARYTWHEETDDRGNALAITAGTIYGVKKTRYNSKDFGVIAVDAACADPNA